MAKPSLSTAIRTIVLGGYDVHTVQRNPGYALILAHRKDEFGNVLNYAFALAEETLTNAQIAAATTAATYYSAKLVAIASTSASDKSFKWSQFLSLFGGPVSSTTPVDPEFNDQLIQLGKNKLPKGMQGKADDLFEAFVEVALGFILWDRVIRYGQARRFEARPDGLVLKSDFVVLYDAKAASRGYKVDINTNRQFKTYIEEFRRAYSSYLPEISSFLVISDQFVQGAEALTSRSRDLQADCGVPLSFMTTTVLAEVVQLLIKNPKMRRSLPWKRILTEPIVDSKTVKSAIASLKKDGILK